MNSTPSLYERAEKFGLIFKTSDDLATEFLLTKEDVIMFSSSEPHAINQLKLFLTGFELGFSAAIDKVAEHIESEAQEIEDYPFGGGYINKRLKSIASEVREVKP